MVAVVCEKRRLENGDSSLGTCLPKFKRRKVSAVRDFPPGCGPNVAPINVQKKEVRSGENEVDGSLKDVEPSGGKGDDLHDGSQKELIIEDPNSSQDLQKVEKESIVKDDTFGTSKDLLEARVESPIPLENTIVLGLKKADNGSTSKMLVEVSSVQQSLLPHHPIPSGLVWKEQKYPPRRRVSAVRDFPGGCGPNVQQLCEAQDRLTCREKIDYAQNDETQSGRGYEADCVFRDTEKGAVSGESGDKLEVQPEPDKVACFKAMVHVSECNKPSKIEGQVEMSKLENAEHHERLMETGEGHGRDDKGVGGSVDGTNKDIIVYAKDKDKKRKPIRVSFGNVELEEKSVVGAHNEMNEITVQALMAAPNCPWGQGKEAVKSSPSTTNIKRSKGKKNDNARQEKDKLLPNNSNGDTKNLGERSKMIVPYIAETETEEVHVGRDEDDSSENEEMSNDFILAPRKGRGEVVLFPLGAGSSSETGVRNKVRETLRLFQAVVRKLLQGEETKTKDETKLKDPDAKKRIDLRAAKILREHGKYINTGKKGLLGAIPGVEVGDFFHYRMELSLIGLHRPPQGGIDYIKQGKKIIAVSIVASGGYANDVDSADVLIYTGQGGNAKSADKEPEDQKLERGNLALKNSIDEKNVVRVIRGFKEAKPSETADGKSKVIATYTYDGLYSVEKYWQDLGPHGKLVYKFELRRLQGQPELAWKEVKRSKKFKEREGRCVDDISGGKETFPICAINTVDDEKPPPFTYITSMMYPSWCQPIPPRGCDCKDECSDSEHCSCAVKNGGEIPYNYNGAIVQAKSLVYECGPLCKCPRSCHNRVSQRGITFPLEIFKTESRGWGVRSLSSIPSGSFICEYIGELLDDKEAEQRTGSDEYLFDIGQNYNDPTLLDGLSALLPDVAPSSGDVVENVGFTIDALYYGNIGRFFNHSCSPNLYAQNVLYDHDDKRIPHIMLFAAENIPPLQELTYHYNYTIDQVFDSDGNIKKKSCYCGSSECTGRMY